MFDLLNSLLINKSLKNIFDIPASGDTLRLAYTEQAL